MLKLFLVRRDAMVCQASRRYQRKRQPKQGVIGYLPTGAHADRWQLLTEIIEIIAAIK